MEPENIQVESKDSEPKKFTVSIRTSCKDQKIQRQLGEKASKNEGKGSIPEGDSKWRIGSSLGSRVEMKNRKLAGIKRVVKGGRKGVDPVKQWNPSERDLNASFPSLPLRSRVDTACLAKTGGEESRRWVVSSGAEGSNNNKISIFLSSIARSAADWRTMHEFGSSHTTVAGRGRTSRDPIRSDYATNENHMGQLPWRPVPTVCHIYFNINFKFCYQ